MATKRVSLPSIGTVTLYKRHGNRSLRLSIGHDGDVRVSMPYWTPYAAGIEFAIAKTAWIINHKLPEPPSLRHGQSIGKAHRLYFISQPPVAHLKTHVSETEIRIHVPADTKPQEASVQQAAQKASIRALRKEAETLLPQRLGTLARQTGLDYQSVSIKRMKSRWGSCSSSQDITLSLFLMQLPWHLIDYVLIHELTHTRLMQHGKPFWQELERHLPNARLLRKEIKAYQPILIPGNMIVA